jgi:hypothetical protein
LQHHCNPKALLTSMPYPMPYVGDLEGRGKRLPPEALGYHPFLAPGRHEESAPRTPAMLDPIAAPLAPQKALYRLGSLKFCSGTDCLGLRLVLRSQPILHFHRLFSKHSGSGRAFKKCVHAAQSLATKNLVGRRLAAVDPVFINCFSLFPRAAKITTLPFSL